MKILLCSVPLSPSIGGIETVSAILAEQFSELGHEVCVATRTAGDPIAAKYTLLRQPAAPALVGAIAAADVILHNNISLRFAWPQMFLRRPWVIAHHVWTPPTGVGRLKRLAMHRAHNIAVSRPVADSLPVPAVVVHNPYAEDVFVTRPEIAKERDLVFLGRLVSDKGTSLLIDALANLRQMGLTPTLTFIGSGPEEPALRRHVRTLGMEPQVQFAGPLHGRELVKHLNAHRIMVVPSIWAEPFGVVVLEGLACGLVPIVARSGGLPEAVGDCGLLVPRSDPVALAEAMHLLLTDAGLHATLAARAPAHVARHSRRAAAIAYLQVLQTALDSARAR